MNAQFDIVFVNKRNPNYKIHIDRITDESSDVASEAKQTLRYDYGEVEEDWEPPVIKKVGSPRPSIFASER